MSKAPTPKLDALRAMREARYEQMFPKTNAAIKKALAQVKVDIAAVPVKKRKKVKP